MIGNQAVEVVADESGGHQCGCATGVTIEAAQDGMIQVLCGLTVGTLLQLAGDDLPKARPAKLGRREGNDLIVAAIARARLSGIGRVQRVIRLSASYCCMFRTTPMTGPAILNVGVMDEISMGL